MNATHVCSLPLHANPGRLDPCIGRLWLALPISRTVIGLWKTSQVSQGLVIELSGHSSEICALAFSNDRIKYLLSACREKILIWDLQNEKEGKISSKPFFTKPGEVTALCFNNNNSIIAAGVDFNILVLKEGSKSPLAVLEAHRGMITKLAFCPHYSATLVSISDDRSFCVWDIQDLLLLFRSKIISSSPLISLTMNWTSPHVAVGTADGCLKVFDLTDGNDFRQLSNINISLALQKLFHRGCFRNSIIPAGATSIKKQGKHPSNMGNDQAENFNAYFSESILSVEYMYFAQEADEFSSCVPVVYKNSGVGDVLHDKPPLICVITSNAILHINSRTSEILTILNLQYPLPSLSFCSSRNIGSFAYAASCQINPYKVLAVGGTIFDRKIEVLNWEISDKNSQISSVKSEESLSSLDIEDDSLSIIPVSALLSSSPLMSEMLPPVRSDHITKSEVAKGKKKPPNVLNQPLTFRSKIKSSGYSQVPRTKMFKPETSRSKLLNISDQTKSKQERVKVSLGKILKAEYDTSKGPPSEHCDTFQVDHEGSAIFTLRFSDEGSDLACALSNKSALALKSPYSKHISTFFVGHNNLLNSVYWSSDAMYLLTASNDKTASVWNKTSGDPILTLTHKRGTVKDLLSPKSSALALRVSSSSGKKCQHSGSSSSGNKSLTPTENKPFDKEIKHAQFFYQDKFILVTHGPELSLYKYHITPDKDDIKRYLSRNRYKLAASWQTSSSSFTGAAGVNTFFSHLVICTTSGRSMEVYDLNKSALAKVFTECHSRPAHCVTINGGSCYASQPPEAHSVIATASPTDPVKLWDLRTKTNVQSLHGHINNAYSCQVAFSPCGNFLASGSEDQMVYVFDLRKGTYIERLRGHNEVVTSVAFHPGYPLLASGSLNGRILFFKSK